MFRQAHANKQVTCPICNNVILERAEVIGDGKLSADEKTMLEEAAETNLKDAEHQPVDDDASLAAQLAAQDAADDERNGWVRD